MEGKKNKEKDEEPMLIPIGTQGKWVMCVSEMAACRSLFALFFKVYDGTMYIRWPTGIATLSFRERGRDKVDVRPSSNRKKKRRIESSEPRRRAAEFAAESAEALAEHVADATDHLGRDVADLIDIRRRISDVGAGVRRRPRSFRLVVTSWLVATTRTQSMKKIN